MTGRRIDGLKALTREQDLEAVKRYFEKHTFAKALEPEHRAHWFEAHMEHAERNGTNISEQLVITRRWRTRWTARIMPVSYWHIYSSRREALCPARPRLRVSSR